MSDRFKKLPRALEEKTRFVRLGASDVPALLAHPDWSSPAPTVLWMHGRTVRKETDPGRYLRWIRSGIAACAIDLPGHGERLDERMHSPERTLYGVEQAVGEVDEVIEALADPRWEGVFDLDRLAIGGMSAGGMVTLRRLCDEHPFVCAAVESTAGDFSKMAYASRYPAELIERLDPMRHLEAWRPIPLLGLHSEADEMVPIEAIRSLFASLRERYEREGADPSMVELKSWASTGAPSEHAGFGRVANDAKNLQVEFLTRHLPG